MAQVLRVLLWLAWLVWCALRLDPVRPVVSPEGYVVLSGRVSEIQCPGPDRCRLILEPALADAHPLSGRVSLRTDGDPMGLVSEGDTIAIRAFVRAERADTNPGVRHAWSPPRVRWRAWQDPTASVGVHPGAPEWRLNAALFSPLSPVASALYRALVLGDRRGLSIAQREAFVDTGTAHLLAISGLHLAVLGWGLYRLLLWLFALSGPFAQTRRLPLGAALAAASIIWAYVLGITPSPATLRAATLLSLIFLGWSLARQVAAPRALITTAVILVSWEPSLVLGASFQLSFAAVGSIVAARPYLTQLDAWLAEPGRVEGASVRWLARWLAQAFSISALTTLATAPLTLAWFGQVSFWGVIVNLVAVPFVSLVVVPLGFGWTALAFLWPSLAALMVRPLDAAAEGLVWGVLACGEWTGPSLSATWPHVFGVLGACGILGVLIGGFWRPLGFTAWLVVGVSLGWPEPSELRLTTLDVGHGDAMVVQAPDGRVALVDTGGQGGRRANTYLARRTLIPALQRLGHARLDALVLTHADLDHVGAAGALMERIRVDELWLPPCALNDPLVRPLVTRVRRSGGRVRVLGRGDRRVWGELRWHVLWPSKALGCEVGTNESGLVIRLDYAGRRILLTADVGLPTELELLQEPWSLKADLFKVGHHGSRGGSDRAFLSAVAPDWALVSGRFVGGRMPPHHDVLTRLSAAGVRLMITGRDGALEARVSPEGALEVRGLRPP